MAGKFMNKVLNTIGWESEPAEEESIQQYDNDEEEAPVAVRRSSYRNNRDNDRDSQADYDRYEDRYDDRAYDDYQDDYQEDSVYRRSYEPKIISHPSSASAPKHRMMIYQLATYEDSRDVIDDLLENHSVLINLENLDLDEAQRIIDTLIGACYAINATIKKAAQQTYLLAPSTVEIAGTYADDGKARTIFNG